MHVTTLLLALLTTTPPESIAAERWIPLPSNPALEVYGKEDATGQFRYSEMRRKADFVTRNYGVNLSDHVPSPGAPVVMGTDGETAKLLISKASAQRSSPAGTSKPCAHSDCPNGRCDRLKPKPNKLPEFMLSGLEFKPVHALIVAGLIVLDVAGMAFLFCVLIFFSYLFAGRPRP